MKITLNPYLGGYLAEFTELPGSPAMGDGLTKEMAIATLFIRNPDCLRYLNKEVLEINEILYESIFKQDR